VYVSFATDGGIYASPNLLAVVPLQGQPLLPKTRYAAIVLHALAGLDGTSDAMGRIAANVKPDSLSGTVFQEYESALTNLNLDSSTVAGMAVFTTDDPTAGLAEFAAKMLALPTPQPAAFNPMPKNVFTDYCQYESTVDMPDYQTGMSPYSTSGGNWGDTPHTETATIYVTVPRTPMPTTAGFPAAVLITTGMGGGDPLVTYGTSATDGGPELTPGEGPGQYFARAGFVGLSFDAPFEGMRDPGGNEDYNIFNFVHPLALLDNVRESAIEYALFAKVAANVTIDLSMCPGASGTLKIDTGTLALMGHSMGAWIAPLTVSVQPMYKAMIIDGAGASWIDNILYKLLPTPVNPILDLTLYKGNYALTYGDLALSFIQWGLEAADPQAYARLDATHTLMFQGIVDHYILPDIANSMSLSLGLPLGGTEVDDPATHHPDLDGQTMWKDVAPLAGLSTVTLPTSGSVLVQWPGDGLHDGHETVYQTDPPKHEYQCFLAGLAKGAPVVVAGAPVSTPCP
jgi:hypothetical protein